MVRNLSLVQCERHSIRKLSFVLHWESTCEFSNAAQSLRFHLLEQELLRITGRLSLLKRKLNLYSELIETLDLYWSEPVLEKIYNNVSKIFDINSRISIMNRKPDYATEE